MASIYQDRFQQLSSNGISLRAVIDGNGPVVILVHGWPESWYSWRHQIAPLVAAGFRVVVPDMRGYGGSDKPDSIAAYSMVNMTDDIVGLIDAVGADQAILVGHDWGAPLVWVTAIRYPQYISGVVGLSVPHLKRGNRNIRRIYEDIYQGEFFYQLYFQTPGVAESELEKDPLVSLRKIYYAASGDNLSTKRGFGIPGQSNNSMLDGMIDPQPFPKWLTAQDLDYFANEFSRSGFAGGLNRYRNYERDWEELPQLSQQKISQPALFIAGDRDPVLDHIPGIRLHEVMDDRYLNLQGKVLIEGAGHWIQQERPEQTNASLLGFLHQFL